MGKILLLTGILILMIASLLFVNSCGDDLNTTTGQVSGSSSLETDDTTPETETNNCTNNDCECSNNTECDDNNDDNSADILKYRTYDLPIDYNNDACFLEKKDAVSFLTCSTLLFTSIKTGTVWSSGRDVIGEELGISIVNMNNTNIYTYTMNKYSTYDSFITDFHSHDEELRYIKGPTNNYEFLKDFLYSQVIDYHNYLKNIQQ